MCTYCNVDFLKSNTFAELWTEGLKELKLTYRALASGKTLDGLSSRTY